MKPIQTLTIVLSLTTLVAFVPVTRANELDTTNPLSREAREKTLNDFLTQFNSVVRHSGRPTQLSDAKAWKRIGNRFAAAYDKDEKAIAIYDLSYPALLSGIALGTIGDPKVTRDDLSRSWKEGLSHKSSLSPALQKAVDALGNNPDKVFSAVELPKSWWKSLPWKTRTPASPPSSFNLSDLDPARLKISADFLKRLRGFYQRVLDDRSNGLSAVDDASLLASIQLHRGASEAYQLVWLDPRGRSASFPPRKLLDFKYPREGFYDNVAVELAAGALEEAASLIPSPVVSALISTVISRISRYYTLTQNQHLRMLQEVMTETSEHSLVDPVLAAFTSSDNKWLIDTFEWTAVTPEDFWTWLFSNPDSAWAKNLRAETACAKNARSWLDKNESSVSELNDRFSQATDPASDSLLVLNTDPCPMSAKAGPTVSINSHSPESVAEYRASMEGLDFGVNFAAHFIPVVGFLVSDAYDLLVQDRVDRSQYVESQLIQHLELRQDHAQWSNDLEILARQRINPFEPSRDETQNMINERAKMIGI